MSIITIPIISVVDMLVVMLSWKEGHEEGWVSLDQNMMYNDMIMIIITIITEKKPNEYPHHYHHHHHNDCCNIEVEGRPR